jgi:hypothetical protein
MPGKTPERGAAKKAAPLSSKGDNEQIIEPER